MAKRLSVFWSIVLIFAAIWFSKEIGWLSYSFDFPWIPAVLVVFALSVLIKKAR